MSSQATTNEDDESEEEVEFVSEGPLRPVLECIDILSDGEEEGCSSSVVTLEDKVTQHKARVVSTLDRLAHRVAQEKKERAAKCRAFKEKLISQKAHAEQELAVSPSFGINQEAKRCVDMWLKMPGLKPGVVGAGSGRRRTPASFPSGRSTHMCPVMNCGRIYDNASLLDGHLKRFDHSPCDPAIYLRGSPTELFACIACGQHHPTKEAWKRHVESKVSSANPDGHTMDQTCQQIVCFACPACYLLFTLRDECLQHMSATNHFTESLAMKESRGTALPVPVPQRVKNRFVTLCKDVSFTVHCSLCHKVLNSHQTAQAHFNVLCRHGCAVAKAEKTIVEVVKKFRVRGQCPLCSRVFFTRAEIEKHKELVQHHVEINQTMAKALLHYSHFHEIQPIQKAATEKEKSQSVGSEISSQKRNQNSDRDGSPAKRQRQSGSAGRRTSAWFCECGLRYSEETKVTKHLLAANQIFHQCGVCGKHMGESSITRLHMSRFHGGAHLSNFLFYCCKCKVEMPRYEDILSHVSDSHRGHTFYTEREVLEDLADAKPSTSGASSPVSEVERKAPETPPSKAERTWMCRMCEDVFPSEDAVRKHCGDASSHSFQRFMCGHCPQKFFKESTVWRHCANEHGGQIRSFHFCGLCDSMQFGSENEFAEHYRSLHSKDYYCVEDAQAVQVTRADAGRQSTCPCLGSEKSKEETKAAYSQCMRSLGAGGKCQYNCATCGVASASYAQIKTHIHTKHAASNLEKTFDVECKTCQAVCKSVPSFHTHYHSQHCMLEPCVSSRPCRKDDTSVTILDAVEIKQVNDEIDDKSLVKFLSMHQAEYKKEADESDDEMKGVSSHSAEEERESAELEEALKRSLLEF